MVKIRKATSSDKEAIDKILIELDINYSAQEYDNFYVAEVNGQVVGTARWNEYDEFFFLSSLGVALNSQNQHIATIMLDKLFNNIKKPVYIYTIIPDFFKKIGFKETVPILTLPKKNLLECDDCFPGVCLCMVRDPR